MNEEEVSFDPMTGEKIVKKVQPEPAEEVSFDPMTGEKIVKKVQPEPAEEVSFDPMTGEKIVKKVQPEPAEEVSFDPMTGEKIVKKVQPEPAEEVSFDPMTGEKIVKKVQPQNAGFDPMTGQRIVKQTAAAAVSGAKQPPLWAGIAAAVAAVVLIVVVGVASGAFLSPSKKILVAARNTVKNVSFMQMESALDMVKDNRYSVTMEGTVKSQRFFGTYASAGKDKSGEIGADIKGMGEVSLQAALSKNDIRIAAPALTDQVLMYNYRDEKDGWLTDVDGEDLTKVMDPVLQALYDGGDKKEATKEFESNFLKLLAKQDYEKSKETFPVNGKSRNCKGYTLTVDEDFMDAYFDLLDDYYSSLIEDMDDDLLDELDLDSHFVDDLRDELEYMDDIDISVYLYSNKIAAVRVEVDGEEAEFQINDVRNPMMGMTFLTDDGDYEIVWEGKKQGSAYTYTLEDDGDEMLAIEYNTKSGEWTMDVADGEVQLSGKVVKKGKTVTYIWDDMYAEDVDIPGFEFSLAISDAVDLVKVSGEVFDVGNASESEIEDFGEDLYNDLQDALEDLEDVVDELDQIL